MRSRRSSGILQRGFEIAKVSQIPGALKLTGGVTRQPLTVPNHVVEPRGRIFAGAEPCASCLIGHISPTFFFSGDERDALPRRIRGGVAFRLRLICTGAFGVVRYGVRRHSVGRGFYETRISSRFILPSASCVPADEVEYPIIAPRVPPAWPQPEGSLWCVMTFGLVSPPRNVSKQRSSVMLRWSRTAGTPLRGALYT